MRFSQTSAPFTHSYNPVFLKKLKSVAFGRKNENPSPYNLCPVFESVEPVPQVRDIRGGLVFFGAMVLAAGFIFFVGLLLNSLKVPGLLAFLLVVLLLYFLFLIAKHALFARRISRAWKNGWIDFYPVLLGSLFHDERNAKRGKKGHFYSTKALVVAPNGESRMLEVSVEGLSSERMVREGAVMARDRQGIRLDGIRNNGWTFWAVVRGQPLEDGSVEHGLSASQVAAGLDRVRHGWPLDRLDSLPDGP